MSSELSTEEPALAMYSYIYLYDWLAEDLRMMMCDHRPEKGS